MTYSLANPYTTSNKFTTNNKDLIEAASDIWTKLSKKTKKYVEQSYFSLKDGNDNLYHFSVNEKLSGGEITYNINEYDNHENDSKFLKILNSNITGGEKEEKKEKDEKHKKHKKDKKHKKHDSSSSSSSSSNPSSSSSNSSSDEDLSIFKFKPKENIRYSSLLIIPVNTYCIEYYNIYNVKLALPYFFSKYTVTLNPFYVL